MLDWMVTCCSVMSGLSFESCYVNFVSKRPSMSNTETVIKCLHLSLLHYSHLFLAILNVLPSTYVCPCLECPGVFCEHTLCRFRLESKY